MGAKTIYIHAGLPKTGTTTIQTTAHMGRAKLAELGITYSNLGRNHGGGVVALASGLSERPETLDKRILRRLQRRVGGAARVADYLRKEIAVAPRKFVLSGEKISRLTVAELLALRNTLDPDHAAAVTVIIYVREPRELLTSQAYEALTRGVPFATSLRRSSALAFRKFIEPSMQAFGEANVRLRLYRSDWGEHGLFGDFLAAIDEDPALAQHFPRRWDRRSLSARSADLLDALLRVDGGPRDATSLSRLRTEYLDVCFPGPRKPLDPAILDPLIEQHRADIDWVSGRLGFDLLAVPTSPRAEAPPFVPVDDDMARFLSMLIDTHPRLRGGHKGSARRPPALRATFKRVRRFGARLMQAAAAKLKL